MRTVLLLLFSTQAFASLMNPLKSDYIDFSKINLEKYLQKREDIIIEKIQSQENSKQIVNFIFEKKLNETEKKLIMHAIDLDGDGKLDMVKHFSNGKLAKMEFDLDGDGKVDEVTEYDAKSGEVLKKTYGQNQSNVWRYWSKGELRLMELDKNNDKKPDMWIHYRQEKVVRTEVDASYDGKSIKEVK